MTTWTIDLQNLKITDVNLKEELASVGKMIHASKQEIILFLSRNKLTDNCIDELTDFLILYPHIKTIYLGNNQLTDQGLIKLQENLSAKGRGEISIFPKPSPTYEVPQLQQPSSNSDDHTEIPSQSFWAKSPLNIFDREPKSVPVHLGLSLGGIIGMGAFMGAVIVGMSFAVTTTLALTLPAVAIGSLFVATILLGAALSVAAGIAGIYVGGYIGGMLGLGMEKLFGCAPDWGTKEDDDVHQQHAKTA